jgi:gamma-glutamylcyclotransferase (GGCT)/AIG2-like uncharacterized protein YtfP
MSHLLFVYGTLLQPGNEFANHLARRCRYLQSGKIRGTLYDVGEYPGLIICNTSAYVYGSIYEIDDEALKLIDAYEGYGEDQDIPNLYLRKLRLIETENGPVDAWVYIYNHPVEGLDKIPSGDYLKYLSKKNPPVDREPGDQSI